MKSADLESEFGFECICSLQGIVNYVFIDFSISLHVDFENESVEFVLFRQFVQIEHRFGCWFQISTFCISSNLKRTSKLAQKTCGIFNVRFSVYGV